MLDWTNESHYLYTQELTKDQWAWEFLRRNPDYQKDYHWFISQWRALEKDYGQSPDMDYQAWKQDPRSYKIIDIDSEQDGNCAISDDKLLIECWMGYKWGFFQFPQAPQLQAINLPNGTNWRPLASTYKAPDNPCEQDKSELMLSVNFDLTKSLKQQLEQVKQQTIIAQRRLRKKGRLQAYTIEGKRALWMSCLRLLDARSQPQSEHQMTENEIASTLYHYHIELISCEADYYIHNYLNILTLMNK
ncbi:MAG: hypothetical protein GQ546_13555 [Gammaproteobacteria bacterium]|nr:hypothetical protein [Gammaproteobacteria bacterium]